MNTLLAVDDGLANANYDWADIWFLVGAVLAVLAAVAYASGAAAATADPPRAAPRIHAWAAVLLALAVGAAAFALFLL